MGTITRTFANNITTSGVFKPTAFNNASFDNVTAVPEGAVEGGNMVLLSTQTASASASISFTSGIDSTYKEYMFIFNNIHPATTANFTFQVNASGQTGFNETITSSVFRAQHTESDSTASLDYKTNLDQAQGTSYQVIGEQISAGSDESCSGKLHLFDPSSDTFVKHFMTNFSGYVDGTTSHNNFTAGYINTTSAITEIDFKMSSGNIDAGTIQMFGIL
tara:strand:- start:67 stop:723 length:657 start_codon:yes stop_codon:yes gene_type:complete